MSVTALATGKKASLLGKQLASQEDIVGVIVMEGVVYVFGFLPSQV
jgi:osmotically-inducible protein OsmY